MQFVTAVMCRRNWSEFNHDQYCGAGFTENIGLFDVRRRQSSLPDGSETVYDLVSLLCQTPLVSARYSRVVLRPVVREYCRIPACWKLRMVGLNLVVFLESGPMQLGNESKN